MKKIVVLASGSGTNFQSILDADAKGILGGKVLALITNKPDIGAIERAKNAGIPAYIIHAKPEENSTELLNILEKIAPDLIVLAGFLAKIPDDVLHRFPDSIINIHPSLLPKFGGKGCYGLNVHKAVLATGETESGCTVHFVDGEYDTGRIIAQERVPVLPGDSPEELAKRITKKRA